MDKKAILESLMIGTLGLSLAGCGNNASKHGDIKKKEDNTEVVSSKKKALNQNSVSQKQKIDTSLWNDNKSEKLNTYIMSWEKTLNQDYAEYGPKNPLNYMGYEYPTIFPQQKVTVKGQPVTVEWSNNGKGDKDYEVVAIYSDLGKTQDPSPHLYFFTIHNGQPVVLITQQTQGNDNNTVDFHPTANQDLADAFTAIVNGQTPRAVNDQSQNSTNQENDQSKGPGKQGNGQLYDPRTKTFAGYHDIHELWNSGHTLSGYLMDVCGYNSDQVYEYIKQHFDEIRPFLGSGELQFYYQKQNSQNENSDSNS